MHAMEFNVSWLTFFLEPEPDHVHPKCHIRPMRVDAYDTDSNAPRNVPLKNKVVTISMASLVPETSAKETWTKGFCTIRRVGVHVIVRRRHNESSVTLRSYFRVLRA